MSGRSAVVESIQSPPSLCQLHCKGRHTLIRSDGYGYGYGFKLGLHQSPTSLPSDDGIRSFVEPRPGFAARGGARGHAPRKGKLPDKKRVVLAFIYNYGLCRREGLANLVEAGGGERGGLIENSKLHFWGDIDVRKK